MNERPILIAEDEEIDVILLKRAFQAAGIGHPIMLARDGQEALEYIASLQQSDANASWPVLFLLDINMPRCSGLEVLSRLREMALSRPIPIIVFSSSNHPRDVEQAYRLGANAYLVKPASTAQRNEMIRIIRAFWLQLNQVPPLSVA